MHSIHMIYLRDTSLRGDTSQDESEAAFNLLKKFTIILSGFVGSFIIL